LDPKNLEKLQKIYRKKERRGEMLPKLKKSKLGSLLGVVCSIYFQNMTLPCKISKQKLAGNAAKHQEKLQNFFV
jgi:hypothetical protein